MARALLDKHKLLILDEATASIDSATDAEISRVVHDQFEGVTVLIIAHRLRVSSPVPESFQSLMPDYHAMHQDSGHGSGTDCTARNSSRAHQ
jgi:ABC-type Mn2+/Zn2+ transport system ATPase subunit